MEVTLYSTPTCPWCKRLKEYLKEKKVSFKDLDVSKNDKARDQMVEKSNQMGVPVTDINGTIIVGFNVEKINNAPFVAHLRTALNNALKLPKYINKY